MSKRWFKPAYGLHGELQPASWQGSLCAIALVAGLTGWSIAFFGTAFGHVLSWPQTVVWLGGVIAMGIAYTVVQAKTSKRNKN